MTRPARHGAELARACRILRLFVAIVAVAVAAIGCTGTREARTPVFLVVADGSRVGIVASPLPPDTVPGTTELEWLPEFERPLPGAVIDLAVSRELPTRVFVAYRDATLDEDFVQPFLAEAIAPGAPETFVPEGDPIPVGALVGESLLTDLCTNALQVTNDGRWLALLHRPEACDAGTSGDAAVLLHLGDDPSVPTVVFPDVGSRQDAATPPLFLEPTGATQAGTMLYLEEDADLVRVTLQADGRAAEPETIPLPAVDFEPVDLGTGGLGLIVAEDDRVHSLPTAATDEPVSLSVTATVLEVVDAAGLPAPAAVLRTTAGLAVRTGIGTAEPPDEAELLLQGVRDAVVGPYGYGFLVLQERVAVVDLLTHVTSADPERDRLAPVPVGGTDMPWTDPVAVDWLFGAVPTVVP